MPFSQIVLVLLLFISILLVMVNRLRMDLAAMIIAVFLGAMQLAGMNMLGPAGSPADAIKAVSGFSQPVVITLIALFIITRALDKSGITRWIAQKLLMLGGKNEGVLILLFTSTTAFLSLFMNNLAAAALLLPSAMEVSRRTRIKPSKLLIPVAYGSLLGGAATYFTTANIIVSDLLRIATPPQAPLNILDFTPTGGLIALAGILFLWIFGKRLLPNREASEEQNLARLTGSELEDLYQLKERLWKAPIRAATHFVGKTLGEAKIGHDWGVTVAAIQRNKGEVLLPSPEEVILAGDSLLLIGREEKINGMKGSGLEIEPAIEMGYLSRLGIHFTEIILAPHSRVEGQTLKQIDFRGKYGLTVIALRRLARSYRTDVGDFILSPGDSFLVIGTEKRIKFLKRSPDFIVIESDPGDKPLDRRMAFLSVSIILAAITASVIGVPVYLCMLAGAVLVVVLGLISMEEAYQAVEWQAVFLIAGMYSASLAMVQSGLAGQLGQVMLQMMTPLGPLGLAAGGYLLSAILTQFIGGQVTALISGPIAISAAISMGVNPQAVAVATAVGCSASFLTPIAHPVNILMVGPANYKFSDFFRIGWLLTLISSVMLLVGMVLFWSL